MMMMIFIYFMRILYKMRFVRCGVVNLGTLEVHGEDVVLVVAPGVLQVMLDVTSIIPWYEMISSNYMKAKQHLSTLEHVESLYRL